MQCASELVFCNWKHKRPPKRLAEAICGGKITPERQHLTLAFDSKTEPKEMKKSYVVLEPFCPVCAPDTAETEHHFVFDCPAYCSIRDSFTAIFWGPAPALSSFFTLHDHRVIAKFLDECFAHRSMLLEVVLGVPQHQWLAFTSSYHCLLTIMSAPKTI